jgi:hypothetical protein
MFQMRYRFVVHKHLPFMIVAHRQVATGDIRVETFDFTGHPAVVVFPDGFCAGLVHEVDPHVEADMRSRLGIEAVDVLVDVAESDLRRLI